MRAWSWSTRYPPTGVSSAETTGSPKFLGNLDCPFARVLTRRRPGLLAPDQYSAAAWPLDPEVQRLPQLVFRRLIARLSDSLSTLRRVRYLTTTQDSLPGCWSGSTGWAFHPQDFAERFQICFLHLILLSQALLGAIGATCAGWQTRSSTHRRGGESDPNVAPCANVRTTPSAGLAVYRTAKALCGVRKSTGSKKITNAGRQYSPNVFQILIPL